MRGRTIFQFLAKIYRLDKAGTAADPDGAGPARSGYDPIYREPIVLPTTDRVGASARQELPVVTVPAQIEVISADKLRALYSGPFPEVALDVVMHCMDLERAGLIDPATGNPVFDRGDRLDSILTRYGATVATYAAPQVFAEQVRLQAFGLGMNRNLLVIRFASRAAG